MTSVAMEREQRTLPRLRRWFLIIQKHSNFYRVHLVAFTITPIIFSLIFYASNGDVKVEYIDALFLCVSSMTVTGLATIDLSPITPWQQAILFIQQCLGNVVVVSWLMIVIRRYFFRSKFDHIVAAALMKRAHDSDVPINAKPSPWWSRLGKSVFHRSTQSNTDTEIKRREAGGPNQKLRPDMIRRVEHAPQPLHPMGWISEGRADPYIRPILEPQRQVDSPPLDLDVDGDESRRHSQGHQLEDEAEDAPARAQRRRLAVPMPRRPSEPGHPQSPTTLRTPRVFTGAFDIPRTHTIEFAPEVGHQRSRKGSGTREPKGGAEQRLGRDTSLRPPRLGSLDERLNRPPMYRTASTATHRSGRGQDVGFGGFPSPYEILGQLFRKAFPNIQLRLSRTLTMPRTTTVLSQTGSHIAPYLTFPAVVGRNSAFQMLTEEHLEELGGVEYRALNMLLWIVGCYHIGLQLFGFIVIAPYISQPEWANAFNSQPTYISPIWFSLFQVASAYTNLGMSLVDTSMVQFQTAYPMIIVLFILILGGNTAFPIFLRFVIWLLSRAVPVGSRASETLHFLLDHPRRCFVYLFPSHQTWFLLAVLSLMLLTDWVSFLVLDIGDAVIESIPLGTRMAVGLLQAAAVRAAGFSALSLSSLAPAVKVLYVIMMYISVYPLALSVRATNVYEERSLGVFDSDEPDDQEPEVAGSRTRIWGTYLAWHARKQLAFDMWWLAFGLWLICIIERGNINDPDKQGWFDIFTIIFELVSAYGTVGLSLGVPYANYSFSGALQPLSKLVLCVVMIRGRHRGLPVAIDRAIMLPSEFTQKADEELDHHHPTSALYERPDGDVEGPGGIFPHRSPLDILSEGDQASRPSEEKNEVQALTDKGPGAKASVTR